MCPIRQDEYVVLCDGKEKLDDKRMQSTITSSNAYVGADVEQKHNSLRNIRKDLFVQTRRSCNG